MTENRALAYGRIVRTLRAVGPAKLWPPEEDCIREAADALLFCDDLVEDSAARSALDLAAGLVEHLIDAERWTAESARRLLDDIWACGPWSVLEFGAA
jgi:hypothetical protein